MQADVWLKLKKFGRRKGLSEEQSEDYASEAFIQLFKGRKATFDQLLVDFKRKEYGDSRSKYFRVRHSKDVTEFERSGGLNHVGPGAEPCSDESGGGNPSDDFIPTGRDGLIWELHYRCGFQLAEIGEWYGVSQSRISHILKRVNKKFKCHALRADLKEKLEVNPNYLELSVDWITL